jgi:hypothetical protein
MDRFKNGTPADKLIGISFTPEELGILFKAAPFRAAVEEMYTLEDAAHVITLGAKLIREFAKRR